MNNSGASESTEIASHVSNTQHIKGVTTSERNYDQTVQDIENQNMQVAIEIETPIVMGTSFNQQQHTVQDIENRNLEEFDGAPPNFVQQQHTVQDNDPNQNNCEGVDSAAPSVSLRLSIQDNGSEILEGIVAASTSVSIQDNESQTSEAPGTGNPSALDIESMYRAALVGDWALAKKLLKKEPTLASKERNCYLPDRETERKWYRPLHVAIALKHDKFALKLIKMMKAEDLTLGDSNELTACSYAAASGKLDIAKVMLEKNPDLVKKHMREELIFFAILSGKSEMVSFFLERIGVDCLRKEGWFDLLQNAIDSKMNGVALKILERDGSLATMSNERGTALHVLARQDISVASTGKPAMAVGSNFGTTLKGVVLQVLKKDGSLATMSNERGTALHMLARQAMAVGSIFGHGKMQPDFRLLAKNLLEKIDEPSALKLLSKPVPILHAAAKVGNMELIHMLTRAYPDLIWQTDDKGRSLLNIAIECREANVFSFIKRFHALDIYSCWLKEDEDKNNLLHLAVKLGPRKNTIPALQMQSELAWYKTVEAMLPVRYIEEKNKDEQTPRDLFVATHEKLLEESKAWMKSTADSCMLIATIILTVVYAAAFTVPGGNNEASGHPILVKSKWLTCFFIFEALALFCSTMCIITFWSITCSGFQEDQFLDILPRQLRLGFTALLGSLIGAISAFLSAYMLLVVQEKAWLVKSFLLLIYAILVLAIFYRFFELRAKTELPACLLMFKGNRQGPYSRRDRSHQDPSGSGSG
ncbi:hypothetical protein C2S51_018478 [Perilla frutescens var. frutescens]|nr:hypothetical protein C2S51_018478 [Perilla frutescens var. frutescens]